MKPYDIFCFLVHRHRHLRHRSDQHLYFDFTEVDDEQRVTEAELRLYKERPQLPDGGHQYTINIYLIKTNGEQEG